MTNIFLIKFAEYNPAKAYEQRQKQFEEDAKIPWQAKLINKFGPDVLSMFGLSRGIEPHRFGQVKAYNASDVTPGETRFLDRIRAMQKAQQEPIIGDNGYLYRNLPTHVPLRRSGWLW